MFPKEIFCNPPKITFFQILEFTVVVGGSWGGWVFGYGWNCNSWLFLCRAVMLSCHVIS